MVESGLFKYDHWPQNTQKKINIICLQAPSRGACNLCLPRPCVDVDDLADCICSFPTQAELWNVRQHVRWEWFFWVGTSLVLLTTTDVQERYLSAHWSDKLIRLRLNICYWWRWAVWKDKYDLSSFALSLEDAATHSTAPLVDVCLISFLLPPSFHHIAVH